MAVKPIPDGYHSVTHCLIVDDAALEFCKNASLIVCVEDVPPDELEMRAAKAMAAA